MILSNQDIEALSSGGSPLISPFNKENLRRASYDLTIGNEYYCGANGKLSLHPVQTRALKPSRSFSVPAHGICYILCNEEISLSSEHTARLSLRMTHVYKGLILTSQPPFDPGYNGKAILMLHNLSSKDIDLKQGERIATIEFHTLKTPALAGKTHRSVFDLESQLSTRVTSSLTEIHKVASKAIRRVNWLTIQLLTFAALLFAAVSYQSNKSDDLLDLKVSQQQATISELKRAVNDQQKTIDALEKSLSELRFTKSTK